MDSPSHYIVVGSGPSGVSATTALVAHGHQVTLVDVGDALDDRRAEVVARMSTQRVEQWSAEDLRVVTGSRDRTKDAVHSKRIYGSSFPFAADDSKPGVKWQRQKGFFHSHAQGGLSNVWGAAMLPVRQQDIADWPIHIRELEPHYKAVMAFVPCTGSQGTLEDLLPSYQKKSTTLHLSNQALDLWKNLEKSQPSLNRSGIHIGKSRLAIQSETDAGEPACQYCALCLSGCPYRLIHSSAHTLRGLVASGNVTYLPGHLAEKFTESDGGIELIGEKTDGSGPFSLRADRLFLAAGVIPTASLVLESLAAFDRPVTLKDSQYFIYPLLKLRKTPAVETERMHTSSQLFIEMENAGFGPELVHLQIYTYSRFLHEELERGVLRWPLKIRAFREAFLGRLLVAQGFLHSSHSGNIRLELKRDAQGHSHLECRAGRQASTSIKILRVGWKLLLQALRTRAVPILPAVKIPTPGSSYHSGGSFPMSKNPQPMQTDTLGRLHGHSRVHLVDASVLPSIPATTVTFTLMANAHRIATSAQALDSK